MKLIILTPNYPRKGALMNGFFIHQQVKALRELGVDCHVILTYNWFPTFGLHRLHPYWKSGYVRKHALLSEHEGVPIHQVPVFIKMPSRFFHEDPYQREASAIIQYIKGNKMLRDAGLIYANFLTDYGYIGTLIKQKLGIKLVAIARGDDVHAWPENDPRLVSNIQVVLRNADLILANSRRLAGDLKKWFEVGFERVIGVVYNGIDYDRFTPVKVSPEKETLRNKFNLPTEHKFLLCVATPVALKGWFELMDAIEHLREEFIGWKLVAVTPKRSGRDAINLNNEAVKRNIHHFFIWLGSVDPEDMPDCYRAMDAFVLPSYNEGLSNSVLEAMACGLPVVVTDVGGHSEFIRTEENGVLIRPQSTQDLVQSLRKILTHERYRLGISMQARDGALSIGSYRANAQNLISYFKNNLVER